MTETYFNIIVQKTAGKLLLIAAVDEDFFGEDLPTISEIQVCKQAPTIYSGTYPTLKVNMATVKEREDLKGCGAAGITTKNQWYCVSREKKDVLGIGV